jgi:serine/threonine protein kinase
MREVALKVLPDVFARDPERMTRFQREGKVLAALNHPEVQCEDLREESMTGLTRGALSADIGRFIVAASSLCVPRCFR